MILHVILLGCIKSHRRETDCKMIRITGAIIWDNVQKINVFSQSNRFDHSSAALNRTDVIPVPNWSEFPGLSFSQNNVFLSFETLIMFLAGGKQWFFVIRNTDHVSCCRNTMIFRHSKHWSHFPLLGSTDFSSFETLIMFLNARKHWRFLVGSIDHVP